MIRLECVYGAVGNIYENHDEYLLILFSTLQAHRMDMMLNQHDYFTHAHRWILVCQSDAILDIDVGNLTNVVAIVTKV